MKRAYLFSILTLAALLSVGLTGCKNPDKGLTPIGGKVRPPGGATPGGMVDSGKSTKVDDVVVGKDGVPGSGDPLNPDFYNRDPEFFKKDTVYFDFDRAAVKSSERSKVENVAGHLQSK